MNFLMRCRRSDKMISFQKKMGKTIFVLILGIIFGVLGAWSSNINDPGSGILHFISLLKVGEITNSLAFFIIMGLMICIDANSPLRAVLNVLVFYVALLLSTLGYNHFIFDQAFVLDYFVIGKNALIFGISSLVMWYSKGEGWLSVLLSSIVFGFFFSQAFNYGMWYFEINTIYEIVIYVLGIVVLHNNISKTSISVLYSLSFAVIFEMLLPYLESLV